MIEYVSVKKKQISEKPKPVSANCVDAARGLIAVRVQLLDPEPKLVELKDHLEEAIAS